MPKDTDLTVAAHFDLGELSIISKYWKIDPSETNNVSLGLRSSDVTCLGNDEDDWIKVRVKWDGCMIVQDNRPFPYHLCDIEDEIGRWTELRMLALEYFGGEFCVGLASDETVHLWGGTYVLDENGNQVVDAE